MHMDLLASLQNSNSKRNRDNSVETNENGKSSNHSLIQFISLISQATGAPPLSTLRPVVKPRINETQQSPTQSLRGSSPPPPALCPLTEACDGEGVLQGRALAEEKQLLLFLHSAGDQSVQVAAEGASGDTRFHSAGQPSNPSIPETLNDLVDA